MSFVDINEIQVYDLIFNKNCFKEITKLSFSNGNYLNLYIKYKNIFKNKDLQRFYRSVRKIKGKEGFYNFKLRTCLIAVDNDYNEDQLTLHKVQMGWNMRWDNVRERKQSFWKWEESCINQKRG